MSSRAVDYDIFMNGEASKKYRKPRVLLLSGALEMDFAAFTELNMMATRGNRDIIIVCTSVDADLLQSIKSANDYTRGVYNRLNIVNMLASPIINQNTKI